MSDFHYDIEKTNHYYIDDITVYGKSVQDGTPTPSSHVPIQVVEAPISLQVNGTTTPIDLQGNVLASLPDGTKDELTIDSAGNVTITKRVGYIASYNGESVGSVYLSTTGELTTGASVYYKLTTSQTIALDPVNLPTDSREPYVISVRTTLTPETAIVQTNTPTYEVENPYEHIPGAKMEIPPVHPLMQEWETFDPNNWDEQTMMEYTYQNEWHAVYTVYLGELMQSGVFDWSRPELNWRDAAIDDEQYQRVCDYFNLRFKWREISMLPVLKWFDYLHNKLVYELMPKYKPLYERVAEGINPLSDNSEYHKSRSIDSAYPETLLSQNADYITQGNDFEEQKIHEAGTADAIVNFADVYKGVDQLLLDELEVMFVSLYTTNVNGL